MKVLILGGNGVLGTELQKCGDVIALGRSECNVMDSDSVFDAVMSHNADIVINCAAVIDNRVIETISTHAVSVNIIGAANVSNVCNSLGIRYVYISTDYLYHGDRGNYKETDPIKPFNLYAWTKLGGECSAVAVQNHLIIRTSFGSDVFPYKQAFVDKWSSKDYVSVIAPMIYEAAISPITGVLNIGTERKTLYDYAKRKNDVEPVKITESSHASPYDTSLNLQKWMDYKSGQPIAKPHTICRCCGSDKLTKYLDLGLMPLANNLEFTAKGAREKERFPLQVMFCEECSLSQLSVVINPVKLFQYYTYRSGVNGGYVTHCKNMAASFEGKLNDTSFHIDIAGNDGTLLKQFKDKFGLRVLNVDPATNLTAISESIGVPACVEFWSSELATKLEKQHGKADLITATNVFAHLDDITDFLIGCKTILSETGTLIIENPYLIDFIENMEYDTVYFEHVTYWSITPMMRLCDKLGLTLYDCEKQDIHGGTMRYYISKKKQQLTKSLTDYFILEKPYSKIETYAKWSEDVKSSAAAFSSNLLELKKQGFKIAAFAASAKGNTLVCHCRINTDVIDFIADETPEKIGKYSPGTGIPIVNKSEIMKQQPDYIVLLAWNVSEIIMQRVRDLGYTGKFIVPIPQFGVL